MGHCGSHFCYLYDLSGGKWVFFFFNLEFFVHREGGLRIQRNSACGSAVWGLFRRKTGQLEFEKQSSHCSLGHMKPWGLAEVLSASED